MAKFTYKGKATNGTTIEGTFEAENLEAAKVLVKKKRIKDAVVKRAGSGGLLLRDGHRSQGHQPLHTTVFRR